MMSVLTCKILEAEGVSRTTWYDHRKGKHTGKHGRSLGRGEGERIRSTVNTYQHLHRRVTVMSSESRLGHHSFPLGGLRCSYPSKTMFLSLATMNRAMRLPGDIVLSSCPKSFRMAFST